MHEIKNKISGMTLSQKNKSLLASGIMIVALILIGLGCFARYQRIQYHEQHAELIRAERLPTRPVKVHHLEEK